MPDSNSACSFVTASTFWSTSVDTVSSDGCSQGILPTVAFALINEFFEPLGAHDCLRGRENAMGANLIEVSKSQRFTAVRIRGCGGEQSEALLSSRDGHLCNKTDSHYKYHTCSYRDVVGNVFYSQSASNNFQQGLTRAPIGHVIRSFYQNDLKIFQVVRSRVYAASDRASIRFHRIDCQNKSN